MTSVNIKTRDGWYISGCSKKLLRYVLWCERRGEPSFKDWCFLSQRRLVKETKMNNTKRSDKTGCRRLPFEYWSLRESDSSYIESNVVDLLKTWPLADIIPVFLSVLATSFEGISESKTKCTYLISDARSSRALCVQSSRPGD